MTRTAAVRVEDRQIVLPATVIPIGGTGALHRGYQGIVDTGAQGTMISPGVVDDLQLVPTSAQDFITADGAVHTRPMCAVGIRLSDDEPVPAPNSDAYAYVLAGVLWDQWAGLEFDVLLGTDWLESFDLTMSGGTFTISKAGAR